MSDKGSFAIDYHDCDDPEIEWESEYKLAGLGETLERIGYCNSCRRKVREVWVYSCELVDE